ncbi:phage portal protein [Tardiphaga sp. vice304]|uniref:phage portal protein n=1 Tax=Tardiphaga sp. vice304 TaxID=2592817 RepID=UPI001163E63F|nr:phage portal protein [Tardiphaga sp. vice304]QDM26990.1 phage portal protein [Tardiphaga sp. vice304]
MTATVFDHTGAPVPSAHIASIRADAAFGYGRPSEPAYRSGSRMSQEMATWRPFGASADAAVLPNRDLTAARVDDLIRNDPHAVSGVASLVDMLIGAGLRRSSKPDMRALGLNPKKEQDRAVARALAESIETEWRTFVEDPLRRCDAQRRLSMNGIFRLLCRTSVIRGEATAVMGWKEGKGRYATCVRVIDPDRLTNPTGYPDCAKMRGGIEFTEDGEPVAYHVRNSHPGDFYSNYPNGLSWTRIPRSTPTGRPVFIHGFEPDRADQARAISPFAALMQRMRMIGKFADTELASAMVNALFAAFVKSNLPVDAVNQSFTPNTATFADKRMDHWEKNPAMLNGVRIPVMPVGDEIALNSSTRETSTFPAFQTAFLQSIAAAMGISYEQISADWSQVNYSSARAALNEVWRHVQTVSSAFYEQVVDPIYFAVMEEAFDRGYVEMPKGAPDFWDVPGAYLKGRWIGPGRGYVDPVKEAEGASMRMGAMISTLEAECADQGRDLEETLDQIAREEEMLKERSLTRTQVGAGRPNPSDVGNDALAPEDKRPGQRSFARKLRPASSIPS